MMQKFFNNILAFGKDLPHEREIGIALIILGIGLILYFQMEESVPARVTRSSGRAAVAAPSLSEQPAVKATPSKSRQEKESPQPTEKAAEKETPSRSRARSKSAAKSPKTSASPARPRRGKTPTKSK